MFAIMSSALLDVIAAVLHSFLPNWACGPRQSVGSCAPVLFVMWGITWCVVWADVYTYLGNSLPFPVGTVTLGYERSMLPLLGLSDAICIGGALLPEI